MSAFRVVAVLLLLTFPAATLAQTPATRLNLTSLDQVAAPSVRASRAVPVPSVRPLFGPVSRQPQPCADSEARGRTDADAKPMHKGWFWGGFGTSVAIGIFGVGVAPATAAIFKPKPKTVPPDVDASCYTQGFSGKARYEHVLAALFGSLAGFGAWVAIYTIAANVD